MVFECRVRGAVPMIESVQSFQVFSVQWVLVNYEVLKRIVCWVRPDNIRNNKFTFNLLYFRLKLLLNIFNQFCLIIILLFQLFFHFISQKLLQLSLNCFLGANQRFIQLIFKLHCLGLNLFLYLNQKIFKILLHFAVLKFNLVLYLYQCGFDWELRVVRWLGDWYC